MTTIQFIVTAIVMATLAVTDLLLHRNRKRKDSLIELNCIFYISDNTDTMLDEYKKQTGVTVDGILGNDFMTRHKYIINYEKMEVRHRSVRISIKDSMEIVEIPLIVLYQNSRKHIFMLDTGAQNSIIHSRCEKDGFEVCESDEDNFSICGIGGYGETTRNVKAKLYYRVK